MESVQYLKWLGGYIVIDFDSLKLQYLSSEEILELKKSPEKIENLILSLKDKKFEERLNMEENRTNKAKIHILPSYNCNYHCAYCYENNRKQCHDRLTPEHIGNILKFYELYRKMFNEDVEISSVTVSGGEPFLPENREIIRTILETWRDVPIEFITNGSRTQDYFELLSEYDNVSLAFSIDGTKDMHYKYRLPSRDEDYECMINAIKTALASKFSIELVAVFHPELEKDYPKFFDFLEELGWRSNSNIALSLSLEYNESGTNDICKDYLKKSIDALIRLKENELRMSVINLRNMIPGCSSLAETINKAMNGIYVPLKCQAQNSPSFTFLPNGKVSFCSCIDKPIGYVGTIENEVVINTERIIQLRNHIAQNIDKCRECNKRAFCRSECPATSLAKTGSYDDAYCGIWEDDCLIERLDEFF